MKKKILLPVMRCGFCLGLGGASLLWPKQTRPERIAQLFEDICIKRAKGIPVSPAAFGVAEFALSHSNWIDPLSKTFLDIDNESCSITTFFPEALSLDDAMILRDLITQQKAKHFPELQFDPNAQMGSISVGWFLGEWGSKQLGLYISLHIQIGAKAREAV